MCFFMHEIDINFQIHVLIGAFFVGVDFFLALFGGGGGVFFTLKKIELNRETSYNAQRCSKPIKSI